MRITQCVIHTGCQTLFKTVLFFVFCCIILQLRRWRRWQIWGMQIHHASNYQKDLINQQKTLLSFSFREKSSSASYNVWDDSAALWMPWQVMSCLWFLKPRHLKYQEEHIRDKTGRVTEWIQEDKNYIYSWRLVSSPQWSCKGLYK